ATKHEIATNTFGTMSRLFKGHAGAFAYLLLILLYFPCVAVLGAVYREAGKTWAIFIAIWATSLGYGIATLYYQIATITLHPLQSIVWVSVVISMLTLGLYNMKWWSERETNLATAVETA
ncbi:hypothetical protein TI03_00425, partial [Achromatium sp. WMS1]